MSSFVDRIDQLDERLDGCFEPIRNSRLLVYVFNTSSAVGDFGAIWHVIGEFSTNVTKLCEWCDYKEWCPAHGGDLTRAREEGTARVGIRRREAGLPVAP